MIRCARSALGRIRASAPSTARRARSGVVPGWPGAASHSRASDLIDGPWAHQPSGSFAAKAACTMLSAITHNLLRAAGTITGTARYPVARGATLRRDLVNVPARLACPQRRPVLHLPAHWPKTKAWQGLWTAVFAT
jgi:hypothetical protein